jgi:organic radical activating enzyme
MSNEQKIQILKDKRDLINSVSHSFCTAKWLQTTLYLQNGFNHSCHHPAPHKIPIDEVLQDPNALHNSNYKKSQRQLMLKGIRPQECSYCWNTEDLGKDYFSDRHYKTSDTWAWDRFEEVAKSDYKKNIIPSYLEVSFSNVCNFKCSYCSSEVSSKWLEEITQHGQYPTVRGNHNLLWLKEIGKYPYKNSEYNPYIEAFWKWFPEILPKLKVFRITGGEPLLSKDTWRVLDYILEQDIPPMELSINTNLCVDDVFIDKLILKVKEIKDKGHDVKIFTSLESIGEKAEYSRYGLNFNTWCSNLDKVLEHTDITVIIMTTINLLSITSFNDFIDLIMSYRIKYNKDFDTNRLPMSINILSWPPYLNISLLPDGLKQKLSSEILSHCEQWLKYFKKEKYARIYLEEWDQIKRMCDYLVTKEFNIQDRVDCINFIREYDLRRNTNFTKVFPEYENLFKEWDFA